jgi:hypothetical protein
MNRPAQALGMPAPVSLRYRLRLRCEATPGAVLVLAVLPACTHHQQLAMERLSVHGASAQSVRVDAATATRFLHLDARGGRLDVDLEARLRLLHAGQGGARVRRGALAQLRLGAPESQRFLRPSRWCASDTLNGLADREFVHIDPPLERMLAIERWVRRRVRVPTAEAATSDPGDEAAGGVRGTLERGVGTATDLAHLTIAMCRASALPARFVTTVPIGSTAAVVPHPWIEVLVDDAWLALDPTRRVPRAALLRLGTGRDASDVPLVIGHGARSGLEVAASLEVEGVSLETLHEQDRRTVAISAATLGSLADATHWHQEARLAARRSQAAVEVTRPSAAEVTRTAPSRLAAAALRVASTTPRDARPVPIFPVDASLQTRTVRLPR